jgi:DNA-directed RNA polymerase subunit M/transcription elongation factor TFIIS
VVEQDCLHFIAKSQKASPIMSAEQEATASSTTASASTNAEAEAKALDQEYEQKIKRQGGSERSHLKCPKCRGQGIYWTGNFSLSGGDVDNTGWCMKRKCGYTWNEVN